MFLIHCDPTWMQCISLYRFVKLETRGFLGRNVDREDVEKVVGQMSYSDFLIFYYLAQSMDKKNFGDLIRYMSNEDPLFRCSIHSSN